MSRVYFLKSGKSQLLLATEPTEKHRKRQGGLGHSQL